MNFNLFALDFSNRQSLDRSFFQTTPKHPYLTVPFLPFDYYYTTRHLVSILNNLQSILLRYLGGLILGDRAPLLDHADGSHGLVLGNPEPLEDLPAAKVVAQDVSLHDD